MTLLELALVVSTLALLAVVTLPNLSQTADNAAHTITRDGLGQVRSAILDAYYHDAYECLPYPVASGRETHPQLTYLFVSPLTHTTLPAYDAVTRRGWRGPYLRGAGAKYQVDVARGFTRLYGEAGDPTPVDGWGRPIVLQQPVLDGTAASAKDLRFARLVSAGPNGVLDTPVTALEPTLAQRGDDVWLSLGGSP